MPDARVPMRPVTEPTCASADPMSDGRTAACSVAPAGPRSRLPVPPSDEEDDKTFTPFDPHRAMKDLEDRGFIETREDGSMIVKDRLTTLG